MADNPHLPNNCNTISISNIRTRNIHILIHIRPVWIIPYHLHP
jgi:hypothetical protein